MKPADVAQRLPEVVAGAWEMVLVFIDCEFDIDYLELPALKLLAFKCQELYRVSHLLEWINKRILQLNLVHGHF